VNLADITPLVLTKDEEVNIGRTLAQLAWATEVVVVDSMSTDRTLEVAGGFPNVRVLQREIDTLAGQTDFGLQQVRTPWVLLLDADFFVPDGFVDELRDLAPPAEVRAYRAAFIYAVNGRPLRASLYPPRVVLLQREHARIWQDGHAHRVLVDGATATLRAKLVHDDRKSFERFIERQKRYMTQEAEKLRTVDPRALSLAGRIRKLIVVAPFAALFHSLFVRGLILDGRPGLRYAAERFTAEWLLSVELLRRLFSR
jgi:glycosyltransferase involved in cell wall biosynthesis